MPAPNRTGPLHEQSLGEQARAMAEDENERAIAELQGKVAQMKGLAFDIEAAIQACELEGVEVWLLADFFKPQISQRLEDIHRVLRGGSWCNDAETHLRSSFRAFTNPTTRDSSSGFRCVLADSEDSVSVTPEFRIGDHIWCESDYRQIMLWADALKMEPSRMIEVLLAGEESQLRYLAKSLRRFVY